MSLLRNLRTNIIINLYFQINGIFIIFIRKQLAEILLFIFRFWLLTLQLALIRIHFPRKNKRFTLTYLTWKKLQIRCTWTNNFSIFRFFTFISIIFFEILIFILYFFFWFLVIFDQLLRVTRRWNIFHRLYYLRR